MIFNTYIDVEHYTKVIRECLTAVNINELGCIVECNDEVKSNKKHLPVTIKKIDDNNIKIFNVDCFLVCRTTNKITLYEASILYDIIHNKIRYSDQILIGNGDFKKKTIRKAIRMPLLKLFEKDWNIYFKSIFVDNEDDNNE